MAGQASRKYPSSVIPSLNVRRNRRDERASFAPVVGAEHPQRQDPRGGRDRGDDPGARSPVTDEIMSIGIVDDDRLFFRHIDP